MTIHGTPKGTPRGTPRSTPAAKASANRRHRKKLNEDAYSVDKVRERQTEKAKPTPKKGNAEAYSVDKVRAAAMQYYSSTTTRGPAGRGQREGAAADGDAVVPEVDVTPL